ncbi:MAG TPA: phage major capsid protein [Acidimicrobiales bacterium]|nr:phage major capsid protein [Acidimicrobiales bacterium]
MHVYTLIMAGIVILVGLVPKLASGPLFQRPTMARLRLSFASQRGSVGTDKVDPLAEVQKRRDAMEDDVANLLNLAASEQRDLTEDEQTTFANFRAEIRKLDDRESELVDMAEQRHKADERRARYQAAVEPDVELVRVRREPLTYERGNGRSFFSDQFRAMPQGGNDPGAIERLQRHAKEIRVEAEQRVREGRSEYRDLTRVDGAGGQFVPPVYLVDQYVALARAARATADLVNVRPLPPGTDSINIPAVSTGTAVAIQTADNAAVQETDLADANLSAPVRTIAGQQDVAVQLLEQSPVAFDEVVFSDLAADYNTKLDVQVLSGSGASGQVTGVRIVSGVNAITYTDASPTVPELYAKLADAIQQIHTGRFLPPTHIIMHPRRWAWFLSSLDSTNRPLVVPSQSGPNNAMGNLTAVGSQEIVGSLMGLPVVTDPSVPITLGAGTEDTIIVMRASDIWLWESTLRTRVLPDVGSGTLTTRLQVYGYVAMQGARYPKAISLITGTGLIAPTF